MVAFSRPGDCHNLMENKRRILPSYLASGLSLFARFIQFEMSWLDCSLLMKGTVYNCGVRISLGNRKDICGQNLSPRLEDKTRPNPLDLEKAGNFNDSWSIASLKRFPICRFCMT